MPAMWASIRDRSAPTRRKAFPSWPHLVPSGIAVDAVEGFMELVGQRAAVMTWSPAWISMVQ
jgi:hypothetical protein